MDARATLDREPIPPYSCAVTYDELTRTAFRTIEDAFEDIDADDADVYCAGNTLTIAFADGQKCIVNTQRAVEQIWLAGDRRAWHFSFDTERACWMDDQGGGVELLAQVAELASVYGVKVAF